MPKKGFVNEQLKQERLGQKNKNSRGQEFEIIEYRKSTDITVLFENGETYTTTYRSFKDGECRPFSESGEKHGDRYTKLWKEWNTMRWRCNPKNKRHRVWYSDKGKVS